MHIFVLLFLQLSVDTTPPPHQQQLREKMMKKKNVTTLPADTAGSAFIKEEDEKSDL